MAQTNTTNAKSARKLDRQVRALELRRMGKGYAEIASILGIGKSQAHRLVTAGLADARHQIDANANDLKAEELSRLDAMMQGVWPDARKGHQGAIDRVLRIMERRSRLLGLDAPTRHAHGGDGNAPPIRTETAYAMTDADLERIAAGRGA